jgi:hypothetical protein
MFSARSTDLESGRAEQAREEEEEEEEEEDLQMKRRSRRSGSDCATAAALHCAATKGKRASFGSRMRSRIKGISKPKSQAYYDRRIS